MFHSRNALWFWMPSQCQHQRHGGELKAWSVIVCSISRGHSRWEFLCIDVAFYLFFTGFYFTVDLLDFDSSLLFTDILLQK